jgi:hypothetical protein
MGTLAEGRDDLRIAGEEPSADLDKTFGSCERETGLEPATSSSEEWLSSFRAKCVTLRVQ